MKQKQITLSKLELQKIQDVLYQFPDVEVFHVLQTNCGIGSITNIEFDLTAYNVIGTFKTNISNQQDW